MTSPKVRDTGPSGGTAQQPPPRGTQAAPLPVTAPSSLLPLASRVRSVFRQPFEFCACGREPGSRVWVRAPGSGAAAACP